MKELKHFMTRIHFDSNFKCRNITSGFYNSFDYAPAPTKCHRILLGQP
jgi:hypothetical protein